MLPLADTLELIICALLILLSVVGNVCLFFSTRRCIRGPLKPSFLLIFSLALVHLLKNLVVNIMKIVFSSGGLLDSVSCKILRFTETLTTELSVWFVLHFAVLHHRELYQIVYPSSETPNLSHQKGHLKAVPILWITGLGVCIPILVCTEKLPPVRTANSTGLLYAQSLNLACKIDFGNQQVEYYYEKIFLVLVDLLPLTVLIFLCCWIAFLLWEQKKQTYGNIWIGEDAAETEIFRGAKVSILLTLLITSLWISHFVLIGFLKDLESCSFTPALLTALSSGFSTVSPYVLMLVHYKVRLEAFCCRKREGSVIQTTNVLSCPYA
ncbi:uncharacterized protein LOC130455432 [Monodelphis domestica]|uniref:uncharacterized protein LOC130455432 n=1 Tax=Monodelphis domestica TaxID=13616 RepID=UPI0024E23EAE|nr:uncharacterized protein LOC130455432 [Monodelphis domestica]